MSEAVCDDTKALPTAEEAWKETRKARPFPMHGGRVIGRVLKNHGIKYVFGVQGGHLWPLEVGLYEHGIPRIHMRHEQAGAYAAEAYARCTRTPGVCYGTAGPGFTNMVSGIAQAYYNRSPLVVLAGHHTRDQDFNRSFQEAYPEEIAKSIAKWTLTTDDYRYIPQYLNKALYDCMTPPPRPIVFSPDMRALMVVPEGRGLLGDLPVAEQPRPTPAGADPRAVEKVIRMILEAERPVIVAGDGLHWSDGGAELREFAELLNIPVQTRRVARGAVPESHPLAFKSGYRTAFWSNADVIVILGLQLGSLEALGLPPVYPKNAKRIIINDYAEDAWQPLPATMRVTADSKVVLRQMIDCAKDLMKEKPERTEWLAWLAQCKRYYEEWQAECLAEYVDHKPVHLVKLCQDVADFADDSATLIYDSFTASYYFNERINAKFPGQILDGGPWGGVGHGIGMGIGAQLARPGKQVIVMMGDGGFGVGGMDVETAARYNLPVCYVVVNNSTWMAGVYENCFVGQAWPWHLTKGCRYDKMFESVGVHGENVEDPKDLVPALERCFNSGKTSVINVVVDERVFQPVLATWAFLAEIRLTVDTSKVPEDWADFYLKGPTPEVMEGLRKKGYPLLKPMTKIPDKLEFSGKGYKQDMSGD